MNSKTIYISLSQSTMVPSRKVTIKDIATVLCSDKNIQYAVSRIYVLTFNDTEQDQTVITVLKLIELISKKFPDISVEAIGSPETIIYYRNLSYTKKFTGKLKVISLMILAFFGTAFSIMSYNGDAGISDLMEELYIMFTGNTPVAGDIGPIMGVVSYSIGLLVGMIIFFNHGINKNKTDDPTPLQVQMRLYEQDVNKCIVVDSSRKDKTIDVD